MSGLQLQTPQCNRKGKREAVFGGAVFLIRERVGNCRVITQRSRWLQDCALEAPVFTQRRFWHILAFLYLSLVCLGRWGEHYTEVALRS